MEGRRKPITQESRDRRRAQIRKRREKIIRMRIGIFVVVIVSVVLGAFLFKKYSPSKEQADLNKYYGITKEGQLAVIIDNKIVGVAGKIVDGVPYIEYSVVRDYLNGRFYVDYNENILLYTLAEGSIQAQVGASEYAYQKETYNRDYMLLKMEGNVAYIALDFVKEYTDIEFQTFQDPARVMIQSDWEEATEATIKKEAKLRSDADIKSPYLITVASKDRVRILEKDGQWSLIRTADGYIGYIKNTALKNEEKVLANRVFEEQVYPNISKKYTINMAWHMVTDRSVNETVLTTIANTKGLTTISPTWFTIDDTDGNITSYASADYVNYAHQAGLEVWALVKDFDGGLSEADVIELLSHTSARTNLINQLMAEVFKYEIDGINVDFEHISEACAEHYLQFLRELSVKCRLNGIVLSVDNYVPAAHNVHYNLEEQGKIVDYVIIMGYDEHYEGAPESGPVASLNFVENGIKNALNLVPADKLINAVPFYARLWKETPVGEGDDQKIEITSEVYRMKSIYSYVEDKVSEVIIDPATGQHYAEWEEEGSVYKIWIEDELSLEAKLRLIQKYDLAGVSAWRLDCEDSSIWDLILKYVN